MPSLSGTQLLQLVGFSAITAALVWVSWKPLHSPGSHGFYRFFAWEADAALFVLVAPSWFDDFFSPLKLISALLMTVGLVLFVEALRLFRAIGKPAAIEDSTQYHFEDTTQLVTIGLFRYIRHPMYASLLLLTWGLFLRGPSIVTVVLSVVATAFLVATARADEREDLGRFGDAYAVYMRSTKMFVPYVW